MDKKMFVFLVALLAINFGFAGPVEKLIESSGSASDYPGSDVLVLFDSTIVDVQETGLSYFYTHQLFKILTKDGALQKRNIEYGYDPLSAFVEIRKVKIYREDGSTEEIDVSKVLDYPAPARAIYWGAREQMIEIGKLNPGDAIEVELFKKGFTYALLTQEDEEKYIPPMRGHFYDIVPFWSEDPVLEKVYISKVPADKPMQYEFYHGECQSSLRLVDGKYVYTFSKKDIARIEREPNMVSISDIAPKLLLSTSPDWEAKSLWFYGVNEDYGSFDPTPEVQAKVNELLEGTKNELDSISILTHWVADNMRYSGISMGPGEGFTLHNADMNFTDRCGVCKDKASLLIAFLRAAGFESYPAMTMAGSRIEDIPADQFNHSVTVVKLADGKYHLLDPTWVPFLRELWSSAEQQQNYLMGVPEGADLGITPLSDPKNHYLIINGESELLSDGTLEGSFTIKGEGQTDASVRRIFTRDYKSEWKENVERELLRINPRAKVVEMDYGDDPMDYQSGPIKMKISYKIPGYAFTGNNMLAFVPLVANNLFISAMPHLYMDTEIKDRKYNFRDRCSRFVDLTETITIPEGFGAIEPVFSTSVEGKEVNYQGGYHQDGNKIIMDQEITLSKRIYEPEDWCKMREVILAQKTIQEKPIILVKQ